MEEESATFAFQLTSHERQYEFYSSTFEELEIWLKKLSKICIRVSLKNDFETGRMLGEGNYAKV